MTSRLHLGLALTLLSVCAFTGTARADDELVALREDGRLYGWFAAVGAHASILSDTRDRGLLSGRFGYGARGGYRHAGYGGFLAVEHNMWLTTENDIEVVQGAVNIGFGFEATYARGFVRTSFSVGPSILAFDTALDDAGTTGVFFDLHPVGLRWTVHKNLVIGLDPIGFALIMPVLDGIPLIDVQYRTDLYLEGVF